MTSATILAVVLMVLPLATIAFAAVAGGGVERRGALIYGACVVLTWSAQALGDRAPYGSFMAIDLLTAAGFAVLMVRNPERLWPGIAGCGQFLVFVFSATRALEFPLSETSYLAALNVSGLTVLAALATGTVVSRWFPPAPSEWDIAEDRLDARPAFPS